MAKSNSAMPALCCFCLTSAVAAAEFESEIPLELAKALIESPQSGEISFYDSPPPLFPEFSIPSEFILMGGIEIAQAGYSRVVLKGPRSQPEGLDMLMSSLESDGYVLMPQMPSAERGFIADDSVRTISNLCNDDIGTLGIRVLDRGGIDGLYSINGSRTTVSAEGTTCGDRVRARYERVNTMTQRMRSGIRGELPIMAMPLEVNSESTGFITGTRSSGSDDYYETASQLVSSHTPAYIHDHITAQLIRQGWELVQQTGDLESNWRKTDGDQLRFGELVVQEIGEETLNLYFRISNNDGLVIDEGILIRQQGI